MPLGMRRSEPHRAPQRGVRRRSTCDPGVLRFSAVHAVYAHTAPQNCSLPVAVIMLFMHRANTARREFSTRITPLQLVSGAAQGYQMPVEVKQMKTDAAAPAPVVEPAQGWSFGGGVG